MTKIVPMAHIILKPKDLFTYNTREFKLEHNAHKTIKKHKPTIRKMHTSKQGVEISNHQK
jgi:hypothetical protein